MTDVQRMILEHGAGLDLGGLNLSITYTEMVHLLPHSCVLSYQKFMIYKTALIWDLSLVLHIETCDYVIVKMTFLCFGFQDKMMVLKRTLAFMTDCLDEDIKQLGDEVAATSSTDTQVTSSVTDPSQKHKKPKSRCVHGKSVRVGLNILYTSSAGYR